MTELEFNQSVENGLSVSSLSIWALIRNFGLKTALRCVIAKKRYTLWLWIMREIRIILILLDNYEKIPVHTPTKLILGVVRSSQMLKNLILRVEKRIKMRII